VLALVFVIAAGIVGAGAVSALSSWHLARAKLSHYKQRLLEKLPEHERALRDITAHIGAQKFKSETERLDFIRTWVNRNSVHEMDDEHYSYASKVHVVVPMLWRRHLSQGDAPHLACGSRAYAMKSILDRLGIHSRVIDVMRSNLARPLLESDSHTFIEAWNKETESWEIQDPDLDVAYRHVATGKRLSVFEMVLGNLEHAEPVNDRGHGWRGLDMYPNRQYFRFAVYRLSYVGERSLAVVNYDRLDSSMKFKLGNEAVTVTELLRRRLGDATVLSSSGPVPNR